jgi:starch synthase
MPEEKPVLKPRLVPKPTSPLDKKAATAAAPDKQGAKAAAPEKKGPTTTPQENKPSAEVPVEKPATAPSPKPRRKTPSSSAPARRRATSTPRVAKPAARKPIVKEPVAAPIAAPSVPAAPPVAAAATAAVAAAVEAAAEPRTAATPIVAQSLSILMVTSEAHPWAKTGGLAEVAASLTDALGDLGHSVTLVLPRYRMVSVEDTERRETRIAFGDRIVPVTFLEKRLSDRVTLVLVDVPELFDRDGIYGTSAGDFPDNAIRYAVFSRAALEYPRLRQFRPSIIHAHDWQTGMVPVFQKMQLSSDPFVGGVPAVFTIHNLAFQGVFPAATVPAIGLGYEVLDVQALEFWGNISYLKGGINFSERITTVSPRYAKEIVTPELGFGFEGVLARRSEDLVGILNGIDTARWTPTRDEFVSASFSADDFTGKREAKRALLSFVSLPADDAALARPLIGLISRLTDQKGFDLILAVADELMALDATWVMLGSGERRYEEAWRSLEARYPDRVSTTIGFDERLAHTIEAGADMFLMPSRFEPCGLNQLYSLRYGTVPIVRATGGLDDTVEDVDAAPATGTGFKFSAYLPAALSGTVKRALAAFGDRDRWQAIARRGMRQDHSWDASARQYVKVYRAMLPSEP